MTSERPTIRDSAADAPKELADNPLIAFWQTMTPEQEDVAEHLAERDRLELEAETERARDEESAA